MTTIATVAALRRFPVKSMQGESVRAGVLGPLGLEHDRRFGVVDAATGKVLSAKREPRLLDGEARLTAEGVVVRVPGHDWMAADHADVTGRSPVGWAARSASNLPTAAARRPTACM